MRDDRVRGDRVRDDRVRDDRVRDSGLLVVSHLWAGYTAAHPVVQDVSFAVATKLQSP